MTPPVSQGQVSEARVKPRKFPSSPQLFYCAASCTGERLRVLAFSLMDFQLPRASSTCFCKLTLAEYPQNFLVLLQATCVQHSTCQGSQGFSPWQEVTGLFF